MSNKSNLQKVLPGYIGITPISMLAISNSNIQTLIRQLIFCNESSDPVFIKVSTSGSTATHDDNHVIFGNKTLAPFETYTFFFSPGYRFFSGQFLVGSASVDNVVSTHVMYDTFLIDIN